MYKKMLFHRTTGFTSFFLIVGFLGIVLVQGVAAQQISTVAVVDIGKIHSVFPRQAAGYINLEKLKQQYQEEIDEEVDKLELLKRQKLLAQKNKNYQQANNIENQINQMINFINLLSENKQKELERKSKSPIAKDFFNTLQKAIVFTAEEKGFTLVFRSSDEGLQWWAPIVDITEDVIKRIRESN